ncbi:MAG: DUF2339 domain-containing protein [Planctomycetota bacterium]
MAEFLVLFGLLIIAAPIVALVWLIRRNFELKDNLAAISRRLGALERSILARETGEPEAPPKAPVSPAPPSHAAPPLVVAPNEPPRRPPEIVPALLATLAPTPAPVSAPTPAPVIAPTPSPSPWPDPNRASTSPTPAAAAINWERFMGVKLFAWVGGLALFLGVAFFVKYSFDNNLLPPELRVAIGFLAGLALLVGGVASSRRDYLVLAHTLCATGIVILYAVTFACRSVYHFEFFGPIPTFLLMALITTTAFFVAVRLDALVVALLGMLGGFLTPILLSTGHDNPLGLFGYIAILDVGLIVVALHRRWHFLTALAAVGTAALEIGWIDKFFRAEKYFEGDKILIAFAVLLGFVALYALAGAWARRRLESNQWLSASVVWLALLAFLYAAWFLLFPTLAARPWLLFSFVFLVDLAVTASVWKDERFAVAQPIAGLFVFGLLALWTDRSLTNELLIAALSYYFGFAILHTVVPIVHKKGRVAWGGQLFPPLALALVLIPILKLSDLSFIVWPVVLLIDLLAVGVALVTSAVLPILAVLLLTLLATGALIFKIPATLTGLPSSFFLLGAFATFFVIVSVWLGRRLKPSATSGDATSSALASDLANAELLRTLLPACSAVLPFLLLIMATLRLPLADPSPVFGVALLLTVLLLGLTRILALDGLPAIALICVASLEGAWYLNHFDPAHAVLPLTWYLVFLALFALFPFLFSSKLRDRIIPWATAALVGVPQFLLIHRLVVAAYPNSVMGLLPAAFAVVPLVSLLVVLRTIPVASPARISQLAWFGGVALFFITLIFPIQFERQWITIGWALEGVALLWLLHRLPHPGLRLAGVLLLIAAFARLAFNPAVFDYHPRAATPILNWYLYAYGIVIVCLFAGARLLAPPRDRLGALNMPAILAALGTVLTFLLLNIEIADYFSPSGVALTFQFSGNFARDMTYSIAWASFALGLLIVGTLRDARGARYGAIGLLCVTLLKLFFHDLARLGQLHRIGALIGVAVIALLASLAYQRFYAARKNEKEAR